MNGPLDGVNVRDPRADVLRLDDQAEQIRRWSRVALLRPLRKLAFVEFVNEQHGVLLISSATRGRTGERSLRRPPLLSAGQPLFGPNGRYPAQASPLAKRALRLIPSQAPTLPSPRGEGNRKPLAGLALRKLVEQAMLGRPHGGLRPRAEIQLAEDVGDVVLDRLVRQKEVGRDLFVGLAVRGQP